MMTVLTLATLLAVSDNGATLKFVESGATVKAGGYRPVRAEMDGKPELVKKAPEGLAAPKYGQLAINGRSWTFIVDEPAGKPARLFVDTNGDGDLTNDPAASWEAKKTGELTMHNGSAKVELAEGRVGVVNLYRFDPADAARSALKNTVLFYADFGYELVLVLDEKEYSTFVAGGLEPNKPIWIDRDGNGKPSYRMETISVGKPFNFTGTTYVLTVKEGMPSLQKATEDLPIAPLPPNLTLGQTALPFKATTTDGAAIDFPKSYAGKIVMIDFWATWCGPCIAELPNVKAAYEKWHGEGFEVLGVSFDQANMEERLAKFTKDNAMPWPQIYEGKFWGTSLGLQYDVSGIPFVLLVDGDNGEIIGTSKELRGPGLTEFIEKALKKKKAAL